MKASHYRATLKTITHGIVLVIAAIGITYIGIWGKKLSYDWFYEKEVRASIQEMVKQEALK